MQRFEFSLDAALRWRQSQLENEERALRKLFVELADLELRARELERAQLGEREFVQTSAARIAEREGLADYLRWAKLERHRLSAAAAECRTRIDRQRSLLLEARRNQELLVKLRMRRRRAWEQAYAKELEDLASEAFLARRNPYRDFPWR